MCQQIFLSAQQALCIGPLEIMEMFLIFKVLLIQVAQLIYVNSKLQIHVQRIMLMRIQYFLQVLQCQQLMLFSQFHLDIQRNSVMFVPSKIHQEHHSPLLSHYSPSHKILSIAPYPCKIIQHSLVHSNFRTIHQGPDLG